MGSAGADSFLLKYELCQSLGKFVGADEGIGPNAFPSGEGFSAAAGTGGQGRPPLQRKNPRRRKSVCGGIFY